MYDPKTQKVIVNRNVVLSEETFPLKYGTEIDTLDILEEEAIDSDVSHDASSTTSDAQKEDYDISSQSTQEGSSEDDEMNSQMRKIHLILEQKIFRKSELHFLIEGIQLGCDSLLLDSIYS
jgi:hypothetical protein